MITWTLILSIIIGFVIGYEYGVVPGVIAGFGLILAWLMDITERSADDIYIERRLIELDSEIKDLKRKMLQMEQRLIDIDEKLEK